MDVPITGLRLVRLQHWNNASLDSLRRMKALGMGWMVQGEPPAMTATASGGNRRARGRGYRRAPRQIVQSIHRLRSSSSIGMEPDGRALRFYTQAAPGSPATNTTAAH